jgi:Rps23 Pro-64 3,4-dihydroxylase Tpa1-like proline 4-hydroxylase
MTPGPDSEIVSFTLNSGLDRAGLARAYQHAGRVRIPQFLESDGAERLLGHIRSRDDWRLVINQGEKLFELDRAAQAALNPDQRDQLETAVTKAARDGFQFRFETIRVPDPDAERLAEGSLLTQFARFMSSDPALDLLRAITGSDVLAFADAQATAYGPRDFLTAHDDEVAGKNRAAAYVMNLTSAWRVDWGGLLMFHTPDGGVADVFTPSFNTLNLFQVPQPHSVSYVTPSVPNRRYAVTGWLRTSPKP